MKEKDYYSDFTKKINIIKKDLELIKKDCEKFDKDIEYIKERERRKEENDNVRQLGNED